MVGLTLANNVAYNVINEKTIHDMLKALAIMYEKPSAPNEINLIWQLATTRMKEEFNDVDHINKFNILLSSLLFMNIKFDDEV